MDLETFLGWLCAIYVIGYILINEINWEAVKEWIFS
jgi:hypothetical protein